jgi:hypothetical protein
VVENLAVGGGGTAALVGVTAAVVAAAVALAVKLAIRPVLGFFRQAG